MIVLDTHIFLWLNLEPEKIPENILAALHNEEQLGLSAISMWEIAMLSSRKRISIPGSLLNWLHTATAHPRFVILPLTPEVAAQSESLSMHGDPADRIITATAIEHGCRLATVDEKLLSLPQLQTVI